MSLKDPNVLNPKRRKRIVIVISNPSASNPAWPLGFWWSELACSYFKFNEKGYEIESSVVVLYHYRIFSPNGGKCESDALSDPRDPSTATQLVEPTCYSASDLR